MNGMTALYLGVLVFFTGCVTVGTNYTVYPTALSNPIFEKFSDDTELVIIFRRYAGKILYTPQFSIRTEQPHCILHVKELGFIRNGKQYYLLKNKKIKISDMTFSEDDGRYYDITENMGIGVNAAWLFRDMEPGDEIELDVWCVYSFDKEPLKERWYKYTVGCGPGFGSEPAFFLLLLFRGWY